MLSILINSVKHCKEHEWGRSSPPGVKWLGRKQMNPYFNWTVQMTSSFYVRGCSFMVGFSSRPEILLKY